MIGGLRRAGAWRRAGSSRVTGNRLRCAAIETPTHRTSWCDPPGPDRVEPSHAVQDPTAAGVLTRILADDDPVAVRHRRCRRS
jgi:hypothetical protein